MRLLMMAAIAAALFAHDPVTNAGQALAAGPETNAAYDAADNISDPSAQACATTGMPTTWYLDADEDGYGDGPDCIDGQRNHVRPVEIPGAHRRVRVGVDDDRPVARRLQCPGGVNAAVVQFEAVTDASGAGTDNQDTFGQGAMRVAVGDQRVAGVVAALETHHCGDTIREQVDDLALALVTPLGADDDYVLAHIDNLCLVTS